MTMRRNPADGPIRTAIIGAGQIVESIHLPILQALPQFDLRLLVDPFATTDRLESMTAGSGCAWSKSTDGVTKESIDLAIVATPVATHGDIARPLLDAGLNLFVEKPLCHEKSAADALVADARRAGLRLFCGQVRRFFPNARLCRRLVTAGTIGRIRSVRCAFGNLYGWERRYFDAEDDAGRLVNEGVLFDVGSHAVDTVAYVFEPELKEFAIEAAVTDDMTTQADVRISGALSTASAGEIPVEISLSNSTALANVFWFQGENGTLMLPAGESAAPVLYMAGERTGVKLTDAHTPAGNPFVRQMQAVADAMKTGDACDIDADRVLATVGALDAAQSKLTAGSCPWIERPEGLPA